MTFTEHFPSEWLSIGTSNTYYILPLLLVACGLLIRWLSRPKLHLPPGPAGLPLVGYLLFLGKEPFKTLDRMKTKYGNVISLYLGQTKVILLADYPAVEEAFKKSATLNRPPGMFDFFPDGLGFGSANGEEWVEHRRFVVKTMSNHGLDKNTWAIIVENEVFDLIRKIAGRNGHPFDISKFLSHSVSGNIASFVFGKRLPPGHLSDALVSSVDRMNEFFAQASISIYYPWISKILAKLKLGSYYRSYNDMMFLTTFVRKEAENNQKFPEDSQGVSFINEYQKVMKTNEIEGKKTTFNGKNLIGDVQSLFSAGTESTTTSLIWLFLAMAGFPEVQRKVKAELESALGEQTMPVWEDRMKFPYTYAVIMEGQRWRTIAPLGVPRMASEDIRVCGYDIQKGSMIMTNIWGLHNDPTYWPEPEKFIPERFLINDGKEVNLKPDNYLPFSYGKRKCPGEMVALIEIFLYFTAIVKLFEICVPNGGKPNLDGILGITYKPESQDLCFIPRQQIPQNI